MFEFFREDKSQPLDYDTADCEQPTPSHDQHLPYSGHHPSNHRSGDTSRFKSATLKAERKTRRNQAKKARRINRH